VVPLFNIVEGREETIIEVKPAKEISAGSLQNPADDKATFRRKNGEDHKGYLFNVSETCSPENAVLTDVSTHKNSLMIPFWRNGCLISRNGQVWKKWW